MRQTYSENQRTFTTPTWHPSLLFVCGVGWEGWLDCVCRIKWRISSVYYLQARVISEGRVYSYFTPPSNQQRLLLINTLLSPWKHHYSLNTRPLSNHNITQRSVSKLEESSAFLEVCLLSTFGVNANAITSGSMSVATVSRKLAFDCELPNKQN